MHSVDELLSLAAILAYPKTQLQWVASEINKCLQIFSLSTQFVQLAGFPLLANAIFQSLYALFAILCHLMSRPN